MIDEKLLVEFEFITEEALPVLRFAVTTTDGLELTDNDIEPLYSKLIARQVIKSNIEVKPTSESKFYINLFVPSPLVTIFLVTIHHLASKRLSAHRSQREIVSGEDCIEIK